MAYTYNDNGQWITGNIQHTDEWVAIVKDEEGQITAPLGLVDQLANEAVEKAIAEIKVAILKAIDTMRVEVDGLAYDGNEPSQARMDRAIQTLVGDEPITWRMYDNSTETLTQTELGKALRAAGVMQTKLWFCSSIEEIEELVGADTEWYAKYSGGEA